LYDSVQFVIMMTDEYNKILYERYLTSLEYIKFLALDCSNEGTNA